MDDIKKAFYDVLEQLGFQGEVEFSFPDKQFGDLSTNIAMRLSKELLKPPREIASEIVSKLSSPIIKSADVAGPGFINVTLADKFLLESASDNSASKRAHTVVIETNNPNPFKAMHIGHAYNSIIADTLANLLEFGGHEVHRVSYHGDVGMHVGRAMYSLLEFVDGNPERLKEVPVAERNSFMSRMYANGSAKYKEDVAAKAQIEELAKQSFAPTDALYKQVYETCKNWSYLEIITGQATVGLEIISALPDVDTLLVPVGGGGLIAGICSSIKQIKPRARVIGVETAACPSARASLHSGRCVPVEALSSHCRWDQRQAVGPLALSDYPGVPG
jgi:arginyl-tRNA synthetase